MENMPDYWCCFFHTWITFKMSEHFFTLSIFSFCKCHFYSKVNAFYQALKNHKANIRPAYQQQADGMSWYIVLKVSLSLYSSLIPKCTCLSTAPHFSKMSFQFTSSKTLFNLWLCWCWWNMLVKNFLYVREPVWWWRQKFKCFFVKYVG